MNSKLQWDSQWSGRTRTVLELGIDDVMDEVLQERLLNLVRAYSHNSRVLEVGCGAARLSCLLASKGFLTIGLDYSESALKAAQQNYYLKHNEGQFVLGDAYNLPFPDESFEIVLSTGLLEHFADPQPVVDEMVRVLKKGGLFYSDIVPKKFSLFRSLNFISNFHAKETIYEKKISRGDVIAHLNKAGLQTIDVFPAGVFPPSLIYDALLCLSRRIFRSDSTIRSILNALMRAFVKPLSRLLDRSIIAEILGFYYFATGRKST